MRVIDCDCGETLSAGNDEDLTRCVEKHIREDHPDLEPEKAGELVSSQAYSATDS